MSVIMACAYFLKLDIPVPFRADFMLFQSIDNTKTNTDT